MFLKALTKLKTDGESSVSTMSDVGNVSIIWRLMSPFSAVSAVPTPLPPGSCVGPYVIKTCLGEDLDGFDYAVEERHSGRAVLLRESCPVGLVQRVGLEVQPFDGDEAEFRDWLARWSRLLDHWQRAARAADPARLGHSALVTIEDRGEAHGTSWVSLSPPGGRSLRQVAEDGPGWPDRATVDAGLHTCCSAVEALHRLGEVHGCLTPERVQVLDNGAWCLLLPDTDPARQPLSPWLALEQTEAGRAAGLTTGPWTDVHGIAVLAHWLLTGSAPPSLSRRQAEEPDCWAALEQAEPDPLRRRALRSALAARPADRLSSVAALRMALGWSERHVPVVAEPRRAPPPPLPLPEPPPAPARRSRASIVALAGLLVSLTAVFVLLWINGMSPAEADLAAVAILEAAPPSAGPAASATIPAPALADVPPSRTPTPAASAAGPAPAAPPTKAAATADTKPKPRSPAASAAMPPARPEPAPVQTAAARRKPSEACIDWLRRRSLEPTDAERERNPACE